MSNDATCGAVSSAASDAYKQTVKEIVEFFGGSQSALKTLGYKSRQTFHVWMSRADMPADTAWKIQGLSEGRFSAAELSKEAAIQAQVRQAHKQIDTLLS